MLLKLVPSIILHDYVHGFMDCWKKFPPKIKAAEKIDVFFSGVIKKVDADLGA